MPRKQASDVLDCVRRASERAASQVHLEMKGRVDGLATVASIAPFFGVLGTCIGIVNSFRGIDGERSSLLGQLAEFLSQAIVPTALGLFVAIMALLFYKYPSSRLAALDAEMNNASLELVSQLAVHLKDSHAA